MNEARPKGGALGRFIPFAWLVMFRYATIETVSISSMPSYIVLASKMP